MSTETTTEQPIEDPSVIRHVLTDAAVATYLVRQGIVIVTIIRNAAGLKTRKVAVEAAARVTTAAGWPAWTLRHLDRVTHELPDKWNEDGTCTKRPPMQVVVVSGKVGR